MNQGHLDKVICSEKLRFFKTRAITLGGKRWESQLEAHACFLSFNIEPVVCHESRPRSLVWNYYLCFKNSCLSYIFVSKRHLKLIQSNLISNSIAPRKSLRYMRVWDIDSIIHFKLYMVFKIKCSRKFNCT